MENETGSLLESIKQYEDQLIQIRKTIDSTADSPAKQDLYALEKDTEELISLTRETINSLTEPSQSSLKKSIVTSKSQTDSLSEEYALFKAELAELEGESTVETKDDSDNSSLNKNNFEISQELQNDLEKLKGSKCQAPYKHTWGEDSYYNALIMNIEVNNRIEDLNHIWVRVMFVNPTVKDMLPCPYYLNGQCRFLDDKCHFSHGELIPLSKIREYREPDFSAVKEGSQVLAKTEDNLWHRAKVQNLLYENRCFVKFESKSCEPIEIDLHDIVPLDGDDESDESICESETELPQEYFVQLSLLRDPPNIALGAWEKHTKGIGSRLMANMGYVVGCGLGKYGEGRLEPVEALVYPPGKSLDACMALKEAAGGDNNMFKAEKKQKREQRHLLRLQHKQKQLIHRSQQDVFSFINSKLSDHAPSKPNSSNQAVLTSSSRKGLNVERFRLGENIKKIQRDIKGFEQSLKRHDKDSITYNTINNKLEEAKVELSRLQSSDQLVAKEQDQRDRHKKMVVF